MAISESQLLHLKNSNQDRVGVRGRRWPIVAHDRLVGGGLRLCWNIAFRRKSLRKKRDGEYCFNTWNAATKIEASCSTAMRRYEAIPTKLDSTVDILLSSGANGNVKPTPRHELYNRYRIYKAA